MGHGSVGHGINGKVFLGYCVVQKKDKSINVILSYTKEVGYNF